VLTLKVWATRPQPPDVELFAAGRKLVGPIKVWRKPAEIEVAVTSDVVVDHQIELVIQATPYVPAREGNPRDPRELGIVLSEVRFVPLSVPISGPASWVYSQP
jgi:hypothetical protein